MTYEILNVMHLRHMYSCIMLSLCLSTPVLTQKVLFILQETNQA